MTVLQIIFTSATWSSVIHSRNFACLSTTSESQRYSIYEVASMTMRHRLFDHVINRISGTIHFPPVPCEKA